MFTILCPLISWAIVTVCFHNILNYSSLRPFRWSMEHHPALTVTPHPHEPDAHGLSIVKSSTPCSGGCVLVRHGAIYLSDMVHGKRFITALIGGRNREWLTLFSTGYSLRLMCMASLTGLPRRWMGAIYGRSNALPVPKKTSRYRRR